VEVASTVDKHTNKEVSSFIFVIEMHYLYFDFILHCQRLHLPWDAREEFVVVGNVRKYRSNISLKIASHKVEVAR